MIKFLKKSHSFKIERIRILGIWSLDHRFNDGLNAIITANKHGKTTLLNIIFVMMGFSDKRSNESKKNASTVYLEFSLNEKLKTIKMETIERKGKFKTHRYIQNGVPIEEYEQEKAKKISKDDINKIIEKDLGLCPYIFRNKIEEKYPLNNLRQAYRAFYLMQGKADEVISDWNATDIRRTVTQSFLRAIEDSNQFEDKSTDFGSKIKEKTNERVSLIRNRNAKQHQIEEIIHETILDEKKIEEIDITESKSLEKVEKDLNSKINEIDNLKNELLESITEIYDEVKNHEKVLKIHESLKVLEGKNEELIKNSAVLEQNILTIKRRIQYYDEEIIEINNKLDNKIYIIPLRLHNPSDICDRCGRRLSSSRLDWEKVTPPKCALCGRERDENLLKPEQLKKRKQKNEKQLDIIKKNFNNKNNELQNLYLEIKKTKEKISDQVKETESCRRRLTKEMTIGIINESKIKESKLNEYREKRRNLHEFRENLKSLSQIDETLKDLKKKKKSYDDDFKFREDIRKDWEHFVQYFMKKVGFEDEEAKLIELDYKTMLPKIDGKSWKDGIVHNEKHLYNLGTYYAFLRCSLKYVIKYPRLVIWDCWKTGELDEGKSRRIGEILSELHEKHYNDFQMIIFTADEIIEEYVPPENILKRESSKDKEEYLFLENGKIKFSRPKIK